MDKHYHCANCGQTIEGEHHEATDVPNNVDSAWAGSTRRYCGACGKRNPGLLLKGFVRKVTA